MAVTIEEVTADVTPPPERATPRSTVPAATPPSELRRQREHAERLQQRAQRIHAD